MRLEARETWVLLATLAALVLVGAPTAGSEPWLFEPGQVDPRGPLGPIVRLADEKWNANFLSAPILLAAVAVAAAAVTVLAGVALSRWSALLLAAGVAAALLVPPVALQVGLRQATQPWFFTNDSTYQIEIAGDAILDGDTPYGRDYRRSGLERFYSLDGSVTEEAREQRVALRHFAYFPGTALTAAAWRSLPRPWDDYRFFVLLATLAALPAALLLPGRFGWRVAAGAALAGNPLAVHAAWFGTADAACLVSTLVGFALLARRRVVLGAVALALAVLLKQFALVALPFAVLILVARSSRRELQLAGATFGGLVLLGFVPFVLLAGPQALWDDTVAYGTATYPIVGYGLSELLFQAGVAEDRLGAYPFVWLALFVWAPVTVWLAVRTWRSGARLSVALLAFGLSLFTLVFVARSFHSSYLVYPLSAAIAAALAAAAEQEEA